jgi:hypothetical protein
MFPVIALTHSTTTTTTSQQQPGSSSHNSQLRPFQLTFTQGFIVGQLSM